MMNPWQVDNLDYFKFLCCPECVFRSKEVTAFESHAVQNHPLSQVLFNSTELYIKDEDIEVKCEVKEDLDNEDLEALTDDNDSEQSDIKVEPEEKPSKFKKEKPYKCKFCPETFRKRSDFRSHVQAGHSNYPCNECNQVFSQSASLTKHKYNKHLKKTCELCNKVYSARILKKHMSTVHADKSIRNFTCDQCPFATYASFKLTEHKNEVHSAKHALNLEGIEIDSTGTLSCPSCSQRVTKSKFVFHYKTAHGCLPPGIPKNKIFMCDKCSEEFTKKQSLVKHLKICSKVDFSGASKSGTAGSTRHHCLLCNIGFVGNQAYICHYKRKHDALPPDFENLEKFYCDICGKSFISLQGLKNHKNYVHEEKKSSSTPAKTYACTKCPKVFNFSKSLTAHILKVHENKLTIKCNECPKMFATNFKLMTHRQMVHAKVKCDICSKELCNKYQLRSHKNKVHGVPPDEMFHCETCDSFFAVQAEFEFHMTSIHGH